MMRKTLTGLLSAALVLASCAERPSLVDPAGFDGEVDGREVGLYTIANGRLAMQFTNYGGRVVSLFVPDRNGKYRDVVLGHKTLDEYVHYTGDRFLGAVVGPVANRICNAAFTVDGQTYHLSANHGGIGTLHGGFKGLDSVVWDVMSVTDSSATLHYLHADGQEGFPGNLDITMTYTLTSDEGWDISYSATTDATRPVNISNHPYFNLSGEGNGTCEEYVISVNGDSFIGADGLDVIETPIPVDGTAFDYRRPHPVRDAITSGDEQIRRGNYGFDHNYCINGIGMRSVATAYDTESGIFLEVFSDQPGLQVYSGQYFSGNEIGKYGGPLVRYGSLTFETQNYPDAPNKASFPDPYLRPGQVYHHHCLYRFSARRNDGVEK